MERLLRFTVLAVSAMTLLWLSGCGGNSGSSSESESEVDPIIEAMRQQSAEIEAHEKRVAEAAEAAAQRDAERDEVERAVAAATQAAQEQQRASEEPSEITKQDYKRGSKLQSSRVNRALGGALRAGEHVQLQNIEHNLEIHGMAQGYPKSHEEFMKLVTVEWGMELPELADGYEYWYDAETHKILKRPSTQGDAAADSE